MKVKTVEALMYGKTIFGTDEAFAGFNFDKYAIATICNDANSFIVAINNFYETSQNNYNDLARKIYLEKYSKEMALVRYKEIINELVNHGNEIFSQNFYEKEKCSILYYTVKCVFL